MCCQLGSACTPRLWLHNPYLRKRFGLNQIILSIKLGSLKTTNCIRASHPSVCSPSLQGKHSEWLRTPFLKLINSNWLFLYYHDKQKLTEDKADKYGKFAYFPHKILTNDKFLNSTALCTTLFSYFDGFKLQNCKAFTYCRLLQNLVRNWQRIWRKWLSK